MKRNSALPTRFPAGYNHHLFNWRRDELGISIREIARKAGMYLEDVRRVFNAEATAKKAYPVSQVLGLDWSMVHRFDLKRSDLHLAVRNGDSGSAG